MMAASSAKASSLLPSATKTKSVVSLFLKSQGQLQHQHQQQLQQARFMSNRVVRVIAREDFGNGKHFKGDVVVVKPGYARNYLIPQKKAVYATKENFFRLGIEDPHSKEQLQQQKAAAEASADDVDLRAAELLKKYLSNKVLKIWRNVDPGTKEVTPGMVDAKAVEMKLSKQLKIDLESEYERVHLLPNPIKFADLSEEDLDDIMVGNDEDVFALPRDPFDRPCSVEIRQLGEFLARISLRGGHKVPLRVEVLPR